MDYQRLQSERTAFNGTDEEFIAYANTPVIVGWRPEWVTANTIRATAAMGGQDAATAIYNALINFEKPDQAATFAAVGFDMSIKDSRDGVDAMVKYNIITPEQGKAILDKAAVYNIPCNVWGFSEITPTDLVKAANHAAWTLARSRAQRIAEAVDAAWQVDGTVLDNTEMNSVA